MPYCHNLDKRTQDTRRTGAGRLKTRAKTKSKIQKPTDRKLRGTNQVTQEDQGTGWGVQETQEWREDEKS